MQFLNLYRYKVEICEPRLSEYVDIICSNSTYLNITVGTYNVKDIFKIKCIYTYYNNNNNDIVVKHKN